MKQTGTWVLCCATPNHDTEQGGDRAHLASSQLSGGSHRRPHEPGTCNSRPRRQPSGVTAAPPSSAQAPESPDASGPHAAQHVGAPARAHASLDRPRARDALCQREPRARGRGTQAPADKLPDAGGLSVSPQANLKPDPCAALFTRA